jgi:hypothetical protein
VSQLLIRWPPPCELFSVDRIILDNALLWEKVEHGKAGGTCLAMLLFLFKKTKKHDAGAASNPSVLFSNFVYTPL